MLYGKRKQRVSTLIVRFDGSPDLVRKNLQALPGLHRVKLSFIQDAVWVEYDASKVTAAEIRHAVGSSSPSIVR